MAAWRNILGISAFYHDAAAALLCDGRITAAAQEERFTRKKNDPDFPHHAARFCLQHANLIPAQLDAVVFYDKPIAKFARLLETYLTVAPGGWRTFPTVLSNWLGEKLDLRKAIRAELPGLRPDCKILFTEHHQSHAASAFYPSPFEEAAILTIDGVGEWATTTISHGTGNPNCFTMVRQWLMGTLGELPEISPGDAESTVIDRDTQPLNAWRHVIIMLYHGFKKHMTADFVAKEKTIISRHPLLPSEIKGKILGLLTVDGSGLD